MKITLYKVTDPPNRLSKTLPVDGNIVLEGSLLADCSIMTPRISMSVNGNISDYNYAYIPDFGRYYFITDIVYGTKGIVTVSMRVDVLTSFANDIIGKTLMAERSTFSYNGSIKDDILPVLSVGRYAQYDCADIKAAGATVDVLDVNDSRSDEAVYVMVIQGDGGNYKLGESLALPKDSQKAFGRTNFNTFYEGEPRYQMYLFDYVSIQSIQKYLAQTASNAASVIMTYVLPAGGYKRGGSFTKDSVIWFGVNKVDVKDIDAGTEWYEHAWDFKPKIFVLADFIYPRVYETADTEYWKYAETKAHLYIPYAGWQDIDTEQVMPGHRIQVLMYPFYTKGDALFAVVDCTLNQILWYGSTRIGSQITLTESNAQKINDNYTSMGIQSAISLVSNGIGAVGGVLSGNPYLIARSAGGAISTVGQMASQPKTWHISTKGKAGNPVADAYMPMKVYLRIEYPQYSVAYGTTAWDNYVRQFGRPVSQPMTISNEETGTVWGDFSAFLTDDSAGTATADEKSQIVQKFREGVKLG